LGGVAENLWWVSREISALADRNTFLPARKTGESERCRNLKGKLKVMKIRKITFTTILVMIACFAPSPGVQATDLDGVLPGGNNADGFRVLTNLTTGGFNTGSGWFSLFSDQTGNFNTATGAGALLVNTSDENTATGAGALLSNTTGLQNTANGAFALLSNTEGSFNTATGDQALFSNTTGGDNGAYGYLALYSNTTGSGNTANGGFALFNNISGFRNTAIGGNALFSNITGDGNTAIGNNSLQDNTGDFNIALGQFAGSNLTAGSNNIDIGNFGLAAEANTIRIGDSDIQTATFIAGISGVPVTGIGVVVAFDGQLGVPASSQRFKDEIRPMDKASEAILALKPVTFRYKHEIDPKRIPQFGLVAEEVAKVNPDLVACDAKGEPYTVRYDAINAMLLNEFIKEHHKVQEQEATIADLRSAIAQQRKDFETAMAQQHKQLQILTASLKEQAAQLQKVSAQVEVSKRAPQTVVDNQ
jgi:hypothetical protein